MAHERKGDLRRSLLAEATGSFFLLATVVGSGIMAETLSGGNVALALLGNTLPTGAILVVIITLFGPISGAHFNPAVSLVFWMRGELSASTFAAYVMAQVAGAVLGVVAAHLMFDMAPIGISHKLREGPSQLFSEAIATFGLVLVILVALEKAANRIPVLVGLYITAAYWFTASTSFANPAVTMARSLTDSFSGIRPIDGLLFVLAQLAGAVAGLLFTRALIGRAHHAGEQIP